MIAFFTAGEYGPNQYFHGIFSTEELARQYYTDNNDDVPMNDGEMMPSFIEVTIDNYMSMNLGFN